MAEQLRLWCFARKTEEGWWAICTSLDIAVEGRTRQETKETLHVAIGEYLSYVATLPAEEQPRFLKRRAPLWLRAQLWLLVALSKLLKTSGHNNGTTRRTIRFRECPVCG